MKTDKLKKLSLNRETIRSLSSGQLDAVGGGTLLPSLFSQPSLPSLHSLPSRPSLPTVHSLLSTI